MEVSTSSKLASARRMSPYVLRVGGGKSILRDGSKSLGSAACGLDAASEVDQVPCSCVFWSLGGMVLIPPPPSKHVFAACGRWGG